jgi:hypothetical protein
VLLEVLTDEALPEEFKPQRTAVLVRFNRLRRPSELSHVPAVDAISVLGPVLIFTINLNDLKLDGRRGRDLFSRQYKLTHCPSDLLHGR